MTTFFLVCSALLHPLLSRAWREEKRCAALLDWGGGTRSCVVDVVPLVARVQAKQLANGTDRNGHEVGKQAPATWTLPAAAGGGASCGRMHQSTSLATYGGGASSTSVWMGRAFLRAWRALTLARSLASYSYCTRPRSGRNARRRRRRAPPAVVVMITHD